MTIKIIKNECENNYLYPVIYTIYRLCRIFTVDVVGVT